MTELTLSLEKLHKACKDAGFRLKLGPKRYELIPIAKRETQRKKDDDTSKPTTPR
jgi:hypothetical protein